jgi:hypothetical protein
MIVLANRGASFNPPHHHVQGIRFSTGKMHQPPGWLAIIEEQT